MDTCLFHMEVWWIQVYVTWRFGGYRFMLHGGLVDTGLCHMEVWWIQVYVTWKFGGYRFMSHGGLVDTGLCQSHGSFGDTDLSIGGGMGDTD